MRKQNLLKDSIENMRVSSVVFVESYLQIVFDDYIFSMFVWPELLSGGKLFKYGNVGYTDLLTKLINHRVVEAIEAPEYISILFASGEKLSVSLKEEDKSSVETATFNAIEGGLFIVW